MRGQYRQHDDAVGGKGNRQHARGETKVSWGLHFARLKILEKLLAHHEKSYRSIPVGP